MPAQKNQHFVPKAYMRPFGADIEKPVSERRAIHLHNIDLAAPKYFVGIRNQCSSNYFYGTDNKIEKLLGDLEGRYAAVEREIDDNRVSKSTLQWLRFFIAIQSYRTEARLEQVREFWIQSAAITFKGKKVDEKEIPEFTHEFLLRHAMKEGRRIIPYLFDLKFCAIRNRTAIPFVTSDDPVIFANRWFMQQYHRTDFGVATSGALFIMPINPRLAVCLYDQGIYSVKQTAGLSLLTKPADALSFNELQYLSAHRNLYFSNKGDGERIADEFAAVRDLRIEQRVKHLEMAEDGKVGGVIRYRRASNLADADSGSSKLVSVRFLSPIPRTWPSVIGFRSKKVFFENGTAMGMVRKPEWLTGIRPE